MKTRVVLSFALISLLLAGRGFAAEGGEEKGEGKSESGGGSKSGERKGDDKDPDYGHRFQFGLRAGLVAGYLMDFRYDQSPLCRAYDPSKQAKDQQKFCGRGAPLALDSALSFALLDFFEPFLWARFGLAADSGSDTKPLMLYGVGARIYTMSDSSFKIFLEPGIAWEVEGGQGHAEWQVTSPVYKKDAIFHLAAGPQLDLAQNFGVYADAGLTTGILRSIHTTLELQVGLQLRAP